MPEYEIRKTYFITSDSLEDVLAVHDVLDDYNILEIYRIAGQHRMRMFTKEE